MLLSESVRGHSYNFPYDPFERDHPVAKTQMYSDSNVPYMTGAKTTGMESGSSHSTSQDSGRCSVADGSSSLLLSNCCLHIHNHCCGSDNCRGKRSTSQPESSIRPVHSLHSSTERRRHSLAVVDVGMQVTSPHRN